MTEGRRQRPCGNNRRARPERRRAVGRRVRDDGVELRARQSRQGPNQKRVEQAIARLNYRPNRSARSLRLSEEYSVGIVIADSDPAFLNDPFISRLVSG